MRKHLWPALPVSLLLSLTLQSKLILIVTLPTKGSARAFYACRELVNFIFGVTRASELQRVRSEDDCTVRFSVGMKARLKLAASVTGFEFTLGEGREG